MACFTVARVRGSLSAEHTTELLASAEALKALALSLVSVLGAEPTLAYRDERLAELVLADLRITISPGGITATSARRSRAEITTLVSQIVTTATALAIPLAIQRTVKAVAARYGQFAVQSDVRQGTNRVVKLKIPVRRS